MYRPIAVPNVWETALPKKRDERTSTYSSTSIRLLRKTLRHHTEGIRVDSLLFIGDGHLIINMSII